MFAVFSDMERCDTVFYSLARHEKDIIIAGLKITAGHRTMSGQGDYLSGQKFEFGSHFDRSHFWKI